MKDLIKVSLLNGDFASIQAAALVLFFGVMVGVFFWIYRPGSKDYYQWVSHDAVKGDE